MPRHQFYGGPHIGRLPIVNCKQLELINLASPPIICRSSRFPFPDSVSLQAFYTPPDAVVTLVAFSQAQPRYPMARWFMLGYLKIHHQLTIGWFEVTWYISQPWWNMHFFVLTCWVGRSFVNPADHPTFFSMQAPSISFKLYTSKSEQILQIAKSPRGISLKVTAKAPEHWWLGRWKIFPFVAKDLFSPEAFSQPHI